MDVSDIILQAVTTAGVEKMKQSFVAVMVWYLSSVVLSWLSVGFSTEVLLDFAQRFLSLCGFPLFTLGAMPP